MARETFIQRQVTQQPQKQRTNYADVALNIASSVKQKKDKTDFINNSTQAQLELNKLSNQYKLDNSGNPEENIQDYYAQRDEIFNKYGSNISPSLRGDWGINKTKLSAQDDLTLDTWTVKQNYNNTLSDIESAMSNNLSLAQSDGMAYGSEELADISSFMNYKQGVENIQQLAGDVVSENELKKLTSDYSSNYINKFTNGLIESNPLKAKEFLKQDWVKNSIDEKNYTKLNKTADTRFKNTNKLKTEDELISAMNSGISLVSASQNQNFTIDEIDEAVAKGKMSDSAKNLLYKMNGFDPIKVSKDTKPTETKAEKAKGKVELYNKVNNFMEDDKNISKTSKDYAKMQDNVFDAINKGYVTQKDGLAIIGKMVQPYAEQYQKEMKNYNEDVLNIDTKLGYSGLDDFYDDNIRIDTWGAETPEAELVNNENKIKMYDLYTGNITKEASALNLSISELSQQPASVKESVLTRAFAKTKQKYASGITGREVESITEADNIISKQKQDLQRERAQVAIDSAYSQPVKQLNAEDSEFLRGL